MASNAQQILQAVPTPASTLSSNATANPTSTPVGTPASTGTPVSTPAGTMISNATSTSSPVGTPASSPASTLSNSSTPASTPAGTPPTNSTPANTLVPTNTPTNTSTPSTSAPTQGKKIIKFTIKANSTYTAAQIKEQFRTQVAKILGVVDEDKIKITITDGDTDVLVENCILSHFSKPPQKTCCEGDQLDRLDQPDQLDLLLLDLLSPNGFRFPLQTTVSDGTGEKLEEWPSNHISTPHLLLPQKIHAKSVGTEEVEE
eukprot:gene3603-298_t